VRKGFFIVYVLLNLVLMNSCASTSKDEKAFSAAEAVNSIGAYTSFYQKFPNSVHAEEARKRASASDKEAFINTCGMGTIGAFKGFMESYPSSRYYALASDRINYLKAASSNNLVKYMQFITRYPQNPFVAEASASYPILWLDMVGTKIGVVVNLGEFVNWKGLFGGGTVTRDKARHNAFEELQKEVGRIGITLTLLDSPEGAKEKNIPVLLVMNYSEKGAIAESMASAIQGVLTGPSTSIKRIITIKNAENGFEYYSKIIDLKARIDDRMALMKALSGFREEYALTPLMIALYDQDPYMQNSAIEALKAVTGQDFKEDRAKWTERWERKKP
jgi:hypothetical protein